jgi:hypothetical protein
MQTIMEIGAHLGGNRDWTDAYQDVVRNLCDASLRSKYVSLKKLVDISGGIVVEKRLSIIEKVAEERHINLS